VRGWTWAWAWAPPSHSSTRRYPCAGSGGGAPDGKYINWLTIADQAASIREDVDRIRGHPLVNKTIPVHGYLYHVETGKLQHVYSV